jgi:hypothetical protein
MLRSASHDCEDLRDELNRDVSVEEVAHRVDEDQPLALPRERLVDLVPVQGQAEAGAAPPRISIHLVSGVAGRLQPLG